MLTLTLLWETHGDYYPRKCKRRVCVLNLYGVETIKTTRIHVNPILCTHMVLNHAKVTIKQEIFIQGMCSGEIFLVKDLRNENPYMRIIISIQNKNFTDFVKMYTTDSLRQNFIRTIIYFLRLRGFDGVKIDVQTAEGGDKHKLTQLFRELMTSMYEEAAQTERRRLLLTVGVPSNRTFLDQYYDLAAIANYVDMLDLASYNFGGPIYEYNPTHHSPLYTEITLSSKNIDFLAFYVATRGVSKDLINVGLALMGVRYTRPNNQSEYFRNVVPVQYGTSCLVRNLAANDYPVEPERGRAVDFYKVNGVYLKKIFYDDPETLRYKAGYITGSGYGGVLLYSVRDDDGWNRCKQGQFPLLTAVYEEYSFLTSALSDPLIVIVQMHRFQASAGRIDEYPPLCRVI
ncbi:hypothetical protein Btru_051405 [Bulinus truncatus]|nr:hypothetical protein Btru_051405 [Bulinus truncatus]